MSCYCVFISKCKQNHLNASRISCARIFPDINDFFMPPESTTAPVGSEAVLSCVTGRSAPYPQVYWVVNGKRLDDANTQTATFGEYDPTGLSAQVSMKLMYLVTGERDRTVRCVAVNPLSGEAVRSDPAVVTPESEFVCVCVCMAVNPLSGETV